MRITIVAEPGLPHLARVESLPDVITAPDETDLRKRAAETDVLLYGLGKPELLKAVWPEFGRLKWIHSLAAGVESLLFPDFVSSPIPLTNARGVYKESLGDFAIGAALFFAKDFRRMLRNQAAGKWEPFDSVELFRQTIGIVGYGEIGNAIATRAKALGMRVLAARRRPELSAGDPAVDAVYATSDLGPMLAQCDYVAAAAPLTPDTRGLIGRCEIASMKRSAVIMNVGRGPVIDEEALIEALRQGRIAGAALDVFNVEPLPPEHPFWRMENVLLSPHSADHVPGWLDAGVNLFLDNLERFRRNDTLRNIVDKQAGY